VGGVRLLVNTDHAACEALLDEARPNSPAMQSMLRMDVARQLILNLAIDRSMNLSSHDPSVEGSVRDVLEAWPETV